MATRIRAVVIARSWYENDTAPIATTAAAFSTGTGTVELVLLPFPTAPKLLKPQARSVPSVLKARLSSEPPARATTLLSWATGAGTLVLVVLPLPSSPKPLPPQAQTVPSGFSARLSIEPAAIATTAGRPVT